MKLPTIIYGGVILLVLLLDFTLNAGPPTKPTPTQLAEFKAKYEQPIQTAGAELVTKSFPVKRSRLLRVRPGIKVINDANLGDEFTVEIPSTIEDNLILNDKDGTLSFGFDRAVRLEEYVKVRINLSRLNPRKLTIRFATVAEGRTRFQPVLETLAPVAVPTLIVDRASATPFDVMTENLILKSTTSLGNISGETNNLEILADVDFNTDSAKINGLKYTNLVWTLDK